MRSKIVKQAQEWLGRNESNGTHKAIIDIYNTQKPLPRGYKVRYTDEWCATFVSAVAIKCGATGIIPTECSCSKMIELFKAKGTFIEDDSYTPLPGDIIFYDWQDTGKGDNKGSSDHIGIVENVSGGVITVIEGNKGEAVARRRVALNGKYIRGFGAPKYATTATTVKKEVKVMVELNELRSGAKGAQVKTLQRLLKALGYSVGVWGIDGSFGSATEKAVFKFQKVNGLSQDGIVGKNTWSKLLKG